MDALRRAGTTVCEPVLDVHLEFPADVLGADHGHAHRRRGRCRARRTSAARVCTLDGEIRAARLHDLQSRLPDLTRGEGVLESAFGGYRAGRRASRRRVRAPTATRSTAPTTSAASRASRFREPDRARPGHADRPGPGAAGSGPRSVRSGDTRRQRTGPNTVATGLAETDYLVVGAGAMGMAFTDALIDHADVHVTLVDRRHAAGGHWQDAYPFVQLHQASLFYGVASTVLGQRRRRRSGVRRRGCRNGPGSRRSRATTTTSCTAASSDPAASRSSAATSTTPTAVAPRDVTRAPATTTEIHVRRRVVDATYLSPTIPATTPPPFGVADDVRVVPVNDLARLDAAPSSYVIVGSGKTATDGIVWLLTQRRAARPHRLGPPARPVDAQPRTSCSPTRWSRSAWPPTRWPPPPTPSRSTTSSCASKRRA